MITRLSYILLFFLSANVSFADDKADFLKALSDNFSMDLVIDSSKSKFCGIVFNAPKDSKLKISKAALALRCSIFVTFKYIDKSNNESSIMRAGGTYASIDIKGKGYDNIPQNILYLPGASKAIANSVKWFIAEYPDLELKSVKIQMCFSELMELPEDIDSRDLTIFTKKIEVSKDDLLNFIKNLPQLYGGIGVLEHDFSEEEIIKKFQIKTE